MKVVIFEHFERSHKDFTFEIFKISFSSFHVVSSSIPSSLSLDGSRSVSPSPVSSISYFTLLKGEGGSFGPALDKLLSVPKLYCLLVDPSSEIIAGVVLNSSFYYTSDKRQMFEPP